MAEGLEEFARPADPVGRVLYAVARWLALFGGLVLFAMAWLMTVSIAGRSAINTPITGDFEYVAIGVGVSVFAFLPWCQLTRANVIVDFFTLKASARTKAVFDAIGCLAYLAIGGLLTWRLALGGFDMYRYAEKTMTSNFPRWTTFPLSVLLMAFLVIVTVYTLWRSVSEARAANGAGKTAAADAAR